MAMIFAAAICTSGSNGAIFPDSGPTTSGSRAVLHGRIALVQLRRRLQLSERFGRQINCGRSPIAMAAATPPSVIVVTIVPELFRMLLAVPG